MKEKRLMERLRAIEENPGWRGETDPKVAVLSVLDHLGKILNTRQGSAPIAEDYGMPDFTSIAVSYGSDSVPEIESAIAGVIGKYEPRLTSVSVGFEAKPESPFTITFKLSALVSVEGRQMPVVFETVLNPDGHITVQE